MKLRFPAILAAAALLAACASVALHARTPASHYGLEKRVATKPYLDMPHTSAGTMPARLSETGAFADVRRMTPAKGLVPYDLVVAFWSDGAVKTRYVAIPEGKVGFSPTGEWTFPNGTVFVKTFVMPGGGDSAAKARRLETRLLVRDENGGVYGVTYKWRADESDADLLPGGASEELVVHEGLGERRQTWEYPSRENCLTCHTARAGLVLGVKTRQMNRDLEYAAGARDNQLRAWNHVGLFSPAIDEPAIDSLPRLARLDDKSVSLADRARSYLDANCSQCHRPGGTVANFDARFDTPLQSQALVDGPVLIDNGIDRARVISPHDFWRSIAFFRMNTVGDARMPPLARHRIDAEGTGLIRDWILSMPGRDVLPPPIITPVGGSFEHGVDVTLAIAEPGAEIRYTVDGSAPGTTDALYAKPLHLEGPTVVRARAYKDGFTRSIIVQEAFIVAP